MAFAFGSAGIIFFVICCRLIKIKPELERISHCPTCDYPLFWEDNVARCPECGTRSKRVAYSHPRQRVNLQSAMAGIVTLGFAGTCGYFLAKAAIDYGLPKVHVASPGLFWRTYQCESPMNFTKAPLDEQIRSTFITDCFGAWSYPERDQGPRSGVLEIQVRVETKFNFLSIEIPGSGLPWKIKENSMDPLQGMIEIPTTDQREFLRKWCEAAIAGGTRLNALNVVHARDSALDMLSDATMIYTSSMKSSNDPVPFSVQRQLGFDGKTVLHSLIEFSDPVVQFIGVMSGLAVAAYFMKWIPSFPKLTRLDVFHVEWRRHNALESNSRL